MNFDEHSFLNCRDKFQYGLPKIQPSASSLSKKLKKFQKISFSFGTKLKGPDNLRPKKKRASPDEMLSQSEARCGAGTNRVGAKNRKSREGGARDCCETWLLLQQTPTRTEQEQTGTRPKQVMQERTGGITAANRQGAGKGCNLEVWMLLEMIGDGKMWKQ